MVSHTERNINLNLNSRPCANAGYCAATINQVQRRVYPLLSSTAVEYISCLNIIYTKYGCIFKIATLYKFVQCGSPCYSGPFLSLSTCSYSTRHSQPDRQYFTIPSFHSSLYKSLKHFGHSFAFDTPITWKELPCNVCSTTYIAFFRKKLNTIPVCKRLSPIACTSPCFMLSFRVCQLMEIKRYKSPHQIR